MKLKGAIGWILAIASGLFYFILWLHAYSYVAEKIGGIITFILFIVTNIVGPLLYIIWHWIADGFDTPYFILWILCLIVWFLGQFLIGSKKS